MYTEEQKGLLLIRDAGRKEEIKEYLYQRYNLHTDEAKDILEFLGRVGDSDSSYELAILDEGVGGLPVTSHTLKTIKGDDLRTNVLYLSTLHELVSSHMTDDSELPDYIMDEDYRYEQASYQLDIRLSLHRPLMEAHSYDEIHRIVCERLLDVFEGDYAVSGVLRLNENPVRRGTLSLFSPGGQLNYSEFHLKGTGHLQEMVDYFKPIHIPDLSVEEDFRRELEEKLGKTCRSVLLIPYQLDGKTLGFIGALMENEERLFCLSEIDLCQRLADITAVVLVSIFARQQCLRLDGVQGDWLSNN